MYRRLKHTFGTKCISRFACFAKTTKLQQRGEMGERLLRGWNMWDAVSQNTTHPVSMMMVATGCCCWLVFD